MSEQTSFYPELAREIVPAQGKLGVLLPGLGAVSTTLIAGVHLINKGLAEPYGSLTQMQKLRLGKRTHPHFVPIKALVPLADLRDVVFGGVGHLSRGCLRVGPYRGGLTGGNAGSGAEGARGHQAVARGV